MALSADINGTECQSARARATPRRISHARPASWDAPVVVRAASVQGSGRVVRSEASPAVISRAGRRRVTSRAELEHAAFDLFGRQGFDRTTVDDIAAAAGIGRRTFFRYFPSKNDVPWGDFEAQLKRMRARLAARQRQTPLMDATRGAFVDFNPVEPAQV